MRAVINGSLISVPDTLYDPLIRQAIEEQAPVFRQAAVIGRVLVRSHGMYGGRMDRYAYGGNDSAGRIIRRDNPGKR